MGERHCMNCGMLIPHKADTCPECGTSLKESAPPISPQEIVPKISLKKPEPESSTQHSKQTSKKTVLIVAAGVTVVACAALFFILHAGQWVENALSRHRENVMAEERAGTTTRQEISIPDISMPNISIPDIQLPEPPAAAFAMESYKIETNPAGDTVLYVNVNYTNKAEREECFLTNFKISVQQEGEACNVTADDPAQESHLLDNLQPDETALITEAFVINTEKETTVSVSAYFGDGNYLEETILPHADGTVTVSE